MQTMYVVIAGRGDWGADEMPFIEVFTTYEAGAAYAQQLIADGFCDYFRVAPRFLAH